MKAIVIEVKNGTTEFLPYSTDEIYIDFRKLCRNSSMLYIDTEEEFDELKDTYIPLETFKEYQGAGVYDYDGNKYPVLKDSGGTVYYIIENYTQTVNNIK